MLSLNWRFAHGAPSVTERALRSQLVRGVALRGVSGKPRGVSAEAAIAAARDVAATTAFQAHFNATRRLRFANGREIGIPVKIVWGDRDRIAPPGKSRVPDDLPRETEVELWEGCGHMLTWDAPERVEGSIRDLVDA